MLSISVQDTGIQHYLQQLHNKLGDITPVLREIGVALESRVSQRFETRTDPSGNAWHPWAQSTINSYPFPGSKAAARAGKPGHQRLLDRYGDMLQGLSSQADANSVRVGFDKGYATFHEFGTKTMPRRGLLLATPETGELAPADAELVIDILQQHLSN